jgi:hypothetical protein
MITIKKNGQKAWVTFTFSPTYTVENVAVSGEWNDWEEEPMKQKKSGDYYITKVLSPGDSFQFGYKVNQNDWITEEECPSVPTVFASQNSLLEV